MEFSFCMHVFRQRALVLLRWHPLWSCISWAHGDKWHQLFQMYMLDGVRYASTVTDKILCVTIHRRHLMLNTSNIHSGQSRRPLRWYFLNVTNAHENQVLA